MQCLPTHWQDISFWKTQVVWVIYVLDYITQGSLWTNQFFFKWRFFLKSWESKEAFPNARNKGLIKGLLTTIVPLFGQKASEVAPLPPDEVMLERLKEAPRCLSFLMRLNLKGGKFDGKNGAKRYRTSKVTLSKRELNLSSNRCFTFLEWSDQVFCIERYKLL